MGNNLKILKPGFSDNIAADLVVKVNKMVAEYARANNMTYSQVIGVLECVKLDFYIESLDNDE